MEILAVLRVLLAAAQQECYTPITVDRLTITSTRIIYTRKGKNPY
jgi:hypothetical protein